MLLPRVLWWPIRALCVADLSIRARCCEVVFWDSGHVVCFLATREKKVRGRDLIETPIFPPYFSIPPKRLDFFDVRTKHPNSLPRSHVTASTAPVNQQPRAQRYTLPFQAPTLIKPGPTHGLGQTWR
jgi:hypothetical protein